MSISRFHAWLVGFCEIAQGLATVLSGALWRPDWTARVRLWALIRMAAEMEAKP